MLVHWTQVLIWVSYLIFLCGTERGSIGISWRGIIGSLKWVFVNRYVTALLELYCPFFKSFPLYTSKGRCKGSSSSVLIWSGTIAQLTPSVLDSKIKDTGSERGGTMWLGKGRFLKIATQKLVYISGTINQKGKGALPFQMFIGIAGAAFTDSIPLLQDEPSRFTVMWKILFPVLLLLPNPAYSTK